MHIYLITNKINGKKYIGLSSKTPVQAKNYYGSGALITKAVKKYGKDNFEKEILEDNIESLSFLCERERYYIQIYDAVKSPEYYNIEDGGISSSFWNSVDDTYKEMISDKISKKLKLYFLNNPMSQRSIDSLNESLRIFYIKRIREEIEFYDILYRDKRFKELKKCRRKSSYKIWINLNNGAKNEISAESKKKIKNVSDKKVYKFDMDGNFIRSYDSLDKAIRDNKLKSKSLLSLACSGKRNHHAGYRWSYKETPHKLKLNPTGRKKGTKDSSKRNVNHSVSNIYKILQFKNDKLIREWESAKDISESLNISKQMLLIKIRSGSEYAGFVWKRGEKYTIVKYSSSRA